MPSFSPRSMSHLSTCDPRLFAIFSRVVRTFDCTVIEGHRGEARQNGMFETGKSHLIWPDSRHNTSPSLAVDVAPFPVDWKDRERFCFFAGFVLATALEMGVRLRWGGDWDGDWELRDNTFDDLPHFEIIS